MKTIVLISCVKTKRSKAKAGDLYISPWFKLALRYTRNQNPDAIFILSAKYGLLDLETEIERYDVTLKEMTSAQRKEWANGVAAQLKEKTDVKNDHFIFLAGQIYRDNLMAHIRDYKIPMKGLGIGKQLQFLKHDVTKTRETLSEIPNCSGEREQN
ncbi:MAG: DUF6884 domain-containing protein [Verrucomicrobiota bacterium]|jgi:hypothetical protein